jgi:hypothetical protein
MSDADATGAREEGVAEVLERLRAGVRQRQAELACLDEQRGDRPAVLAAVARDAAIEEPNFRVEGVSALRAFLERAAYVLFARRQHRTLLRQQNRFNRSAALALDDLHARQETLAGEVRQLAQRVADLEASPSAGEAARVEGPGAAAGAPRALSRGGRAGSS